MLLIDHFAGQALQALLTQPAMSLIEPSDLAERAYNIGLAMMNEREKHTR